MKIYLSHSCAYDYEKLIYGPIKASSLYEEHDFFLPHDVNKDGVNTKELMKNYDVVIAEVSNVGTGIGIELGRADAYGIPIFCLYKEGATPTSSLRFVTKNIVAYSDTADFLAKLTQIVNGL